MTRIAVKKAIKSDIPNLQKLASDSFYVTYGPYNASHVLDDYVAKHFSGEQLHREFDDPKNHFYVSEHEGQLTGYMKLREDSLPKCRLDGNPLEIERIYAHPQLKRRGIGGALINAAVERANSMGYTGVWLGVFQQNKPAVAFYKKQGFTIAGDAIFMMGDDPQKDYVMVKAI